MNRISRIEIKGFKSIEDAGEDAGVDLGNIDILTGANGAGKSNLVSFLKMLNRTITEGLRIFTSRSDGSL